MWLFFFIMVAGHLYRPSICSILFYDFIEILCMILTIRIFCVCVYIYIYTHSALQKYWKSKDKIALLAVESRHLQIWLKDEYETKLQNVTFYYWVIQHLDVLPDKKISTFRVSSPIWCEHKYWNSCLTGLSKWSAVSCCINSSGIKSRECVVSVISITSAFWLLHSMMTHSNQDEADF